MVELRDLRGAHSEQRVFLIGNGPSLKRNPLESLIDEWTIAMNDIHRIYPETEWRPDYYLNVQSPRLVENPSMEWIDEYVRSPMATARLGVPSFFASYKRSLFPAYDNIIYLEKTQLDLDSNVLLHKTIHGGNIDTFWQRDVTEGVYRLHTSMHVAAQIAAYMGFSELVFLGCDLYPEFKPFPHRIFAGGTDPEAYSRAPHPPGEEGYIDFLRSEAAPIRSAVNGAMYKALRNQSLMKVLYSFLDTTGLLQPSHFTTGTAEPHFVEDYNTTIDTDHGFIVYGTNRNFVLAHKLIKAVGEQLGFETYNATLGGQLEVHERVSLENIIDE